MIDSKVEGDERQHRSHWLMHAGRLQPRLKDDGEDRERVGDAGVRARAGEVR
jgi:hypothetical protein